MTLESSCNRVWDGEVTKIVSRETNFQKKSHRDSRIEIKIGTIDFLANVSKYLRKRYISTRGYKSSFTVYLYTLTHLLRVTSSCSRRIANNHQMEILAQRSINRYKIRKYDNHIFATMQKYEPEKKEMERKTEKGKNYTIGGSQNWYNTKDWTFRIAMLY